MTKIGVFDSGIGGLSVAQAIEKAFPEDTVLFLNDSQHVPYGNRTAEEITTLAVPILHELVEQGSEVIVVACNTVTTNIIEELRPLMPVPLIGMEPMIKPAVGLTKSTIIAVCATPATLASPRYAWLKDTYAKNINVIEPDCSNWSAMIEANKLDRAFVTDQIDEVCRRGADVIVLGCTHYHWIQEEIQKASRGRAVVIQPEEAIISRLKQVIKTL